VRLGIKLGMTPSEAGRRLTTKDMAQMVAFEILQEEYHVKAKREAELTQRASENRKGAR
jgi:hypothetical protein